VVALTVIVLVRGLPHLTVISRPGGVIVPIRLADVDASAVSA
jgi:hypothetical protein